MGARGWCRCISTVGEGLASGDITKLAGFVNVRRSHWVAIEIDAQDGTLLYGDSMGCPIFDDQLIDAIQWWIKTHCGTYFDEMPMPATTQNDSYSCGILAYNALGHSLLPHSIPLLRAEDATMERLKILKSIAMLHESDVSIPHIF